MRIAIIPNCTGIHAIREDGVVINTKTGRIMKSSLNDTGYERVSITVSKNKVLNFKIHRLIAENFIPNQQPHRNTVNHIDGNKLNNSIENLEWCTQAENNRHARATGLNTSVGMRRKSVSVKINPRNELMKELYIHSPISMQAVGKKFGLKSSQAARVLKGLKKCTSLKAPSPTNKSN
ncbi:hypothetical protein CIG19_16735 [Enterobacterales bacterium CwR94]|nr:hypothetical protein CIG19_16735 [Enterobacterales bacterium CwR94]